jgi:hypothetical protein
MINVSSSKQLAGMDMTLETLDLLSSSRSAKCVFCVDSFLTCILMNMGSAIRVFQDLQTHFIRIRDFPGRKDRTSITRSSGRITCDFAIWEEEDDGVA